MAQPAQQLDLAQRGLAHLRCIRILPVNTALELFDCHNVACLAVAALEYGAKGALQVAAAAGAAGEQAQPAVQAPVAGAATGPRDTAPLETEQPASHLADAPQILIGLQAAAAGSRTAVGQDRRKRARIEPPLQLAPRWRLGGGARTSIAHADLAQLAGRAVKRGVQDPAQLRSIGSGPVWASMNVYMHMACQNEAKGLWDCADCRVCISPADLAVAAVFACLVRPFGDPQHSSNLAHTWGSTGGPGSPWRTPTPDHRLPTWGRRSGPRPAARTWRRYGASRPSCTAAYCCTSRPARWGLGQ